LRRAQVAEAEQAVLEEAVRAPAEEREQVAAGPVEQPAVHLAARQAAPAPGPLAAEVRPARNRAEPVA
jgi:hypothetical protein